VNYRTSTPLYDLDLGRFTGDQGKPERRSNQLLRRSVEQALGRGIYEAHIAVAVDDDDTVGKPLDDRP
jgi:hypothetical protein